MFGPIKNIIFDLDGTLVNTMGRVVGGIQHAVEQLRGAPVDRNEVLVNFTPSSAEVLNYWTSSDEERDAFLRAWQEYNEQFETFSDIFEGVEELLESLQAASIKTFIFTGRGREGSLKILREQNWLGRYFEETGLVCGDDPFEPKPSAEGVLHLLERYSLEPSETLLVGDHPHDLRAGREAHVRTAAALWDMTLVPEGSAKKRFRSLWEAVDDDLADVRLNAPNALEAWLKMSDE